LKVKCAIYTPLLEANGTAICLNGCFERERERERERENLKQMLK